MGEGSMYLPVVVAILFEDVPQEHTNLACRLASSQRALVLCNGVDSTAFLLDG
jgi:hypothetical protein